MGKTRDVFICHASEDKQAVAGPLFDALSRESITSWIDEAEIRWGDSITQKVNEGLAMSRFVIVVLSRNFIAKNWPQRELNSALNLEAASGEVRVLPLIVGTKEDERKILATYPLLNDKKYLRWEADTSPIINELRVRLSSSGAFIKEKARPVKQKIPMPKVKKPFTQRDKDQYLRNAFDIIRSYFEQGVRELTEATPQIEADLEQIHRYKFVCSFYNAGQLVNRCKIWIGGPLSADSIAYYEGREINFNSDTSCNDWVTIEISSEGIGLKPSNIGFGTGLNQNDQVLSPERCAEYFWKRATNKLAGS